MVFIFTVAFLFVLILYSGIFIVNEGSVVVLTQFGRIIGAPYDRAGLYFKIPFIWKAIYFDKRIFSEEDLQVYVATKDNYFISVDTVINWRVSDASLFYQNMDDLTTTRELLKNIVTGGVREIIAKYELIETVRSKNVKLNLYSQVLAGILQLNRPSIGLHGDIYFGRAKLSRMMKEKNYDYTAHYGMEVVGVLIRNINYGPIVERAINDRMVLERLSRAEELRSTGRKNYLIILGVIQQKYQEIIAPAKMEAELIKGQADAEATKIYAKAYGSNPNFYNFWRTLIAYETGIPPKSQGAILSTDNGFLKLLNGKNSKNNFQE